MRKNRSHDGIDQCRPQQITRDIVFETEHVERGGRRQIPQNDGKRAQRDNRIQQVQSDRKNSGVDKLPDVFRNALVGIVGGVPKQLHAVVVGPGKPPVEIGLRQPTPPPDLQPLIEVKLIDRKKDKSGGQDAEIAKLIDKGVPILVLQRVVEGVVPGIEQDIQSND